jgi:L-iditol 2-dehydrogenase
VIGAVFHGPGQLEVGEVSKPEISPDEVLVKVGANTVCGTDVRILRGEKTRGIATPVTSPKSVGTSRATRWGLRLRWLQR